jgi:hypothetical protein
VKLSPEQSALFATINLAAMVALDRLDGPDADGQSVRLFATMQAGRAHPGTLIWNGRRLDVGAFCQAMRDERRLIYELEPARAYGLIRPAGAAA